MIQHSTLVKTADKKTVHVVVCARNNRITIGPALENLAAQTFRDFSCVVVDGCSSDGTPQYVGDRFPWVDVFVKADDSGPAASRNIGARRATSDYILFQDSDVRLDPDWISQQLTFLETHPQVGIVCGALVYEDEPDVIQATYGAMNRYAIAWDAGEGQAFDPGSMTSRLCIWAISAAMLVRRETFEAIGGFDEAMFAFHEDSDFGWRANISGFRVAFNPRARAEHRAHSTMNARTMGGSITYLLYRNRIRSALVNYEWHSAIRYLSVHLLLASIDAALRPPRLAKLRGVLWNFRHLSDTLVRRRATQIKRCVPDRDLWPLFEPGFRGPGRP